MTSTTTQRTNDLTTSRTPLMAALGVGTSAVLTAIGSFLGENNTGDATRDDVSTWLITVGIAVAVAAVVFGLAVRTAGQGNPGRRALILGIISVLSIAVFWAGITTVIAAAAAACAFIERDTRGETGGMSKAGLVLAALSTVAVIWLAFTG